MEFELDKLALLCVSKNRILCEDNPCKTKPTPHLAITIHNHIINSSHSHKFLGIIIDNKLKFEEHAAYTLAKGTTYAMACKCIISPIKGRLFFTLTYFCIYMADIWCAGLISKGRGQKGKGRGIRGFSLQMVQVQRMATLLIISRLRSSATDLLDSHTNILPFH
ncbi:hypothetical protein EDD22DRAFT_782828 [Suillus occidentalis]|nr:hypothetical protein EDD22DRAFT_782828 [Suillus occidentalis]